MDSSSPLYAGPPSRSIHQMARAAADRLQNRSPASLAAKAGALLLEDGGLLLPVLGQEVRVSLPACRTDPLLEDWLYLLLLHYLDMADGTPLSGRWISFGEMKDGVIRGGKFDRTAEGTLSRLLSPLTPALVEAACRQVGGRPQPGKADLSVVFPLLPRFPVLLNLWFADEEFPLSARMLVDSTAHRYLTVEDGVVAGELLLRRLAAALP